MSYDHMSAARGLQHPGGNCAGISAFFFPEYVLAAHANAAVLNRLDHCGNVNKRRAEHDLIACMSPAQWQECGNKITRLLRRLIHFPVRSDQFLSHEVASSWI